MGSGGSSLEPYLDKKIRIFIQDQALYTMTEGFLRALGFTNVETTTVSGSYISSVQQLFQLLRKDDDIILVNPPLVVTSGTTKIKKDIHEFFRDLHRMMEQQNRKNSLQVISRCIPIFAEAKLLQMRERLLFGLAEFGVSAAFILKPQESLVGLSARAQKELKAELMRERFDEIKEYLIEFLTMDREEVLENIKNRLSEEELQKKKLEADRYMAEAEELKKTGNFEEAINAYKKAIDAYPQNVDAYLESGKAYVRIQKYTRALQRFQQATTIAEDLPTPNQEIGNMRVKQVKEMIERGEDPDSPEIKQYMSEAVEHFGVALKKASELKPLGEDQTEDIAKESVAKIAGQMFKLGLGEDLGSDHPFTRQLASIAGSALNDISKDDPGHKHPAQLIGMGLAAIEMGNFDDAERHLFMASKDKEHFSDACFELN